MIKAIVFDMGGVILDLDLPGCVEAFRREAGFERAGEFLDACHQSGIFADLERGLFSEEEYFNEARKYCRPGVSNRLLAECQFKIVTGIAPGKPEYIRELSDRYPLYILSNNNPVTMPECKRIFREAGIDMDTTFRELFISAEMKMMKPEPDIYIEAIRRTGLESSELLFIDDSKANVATALTLGMRAVHYVPGTSLRDVIEPELNV